MPKYNDALRKANAEKKLKKLWGKDYELKLAKAKSWVASTFADPREFAELRMPHGDLVGNHPPTLIAFAEGRLPSWFLASPLNRGMIEMALNSPINIIPQPRDEQRDTSTTVSNDHRDHDD